MKQKKNTTTEKTLFSLAIGLTLFGLLMIASAGAAYSETRFGNQWFFVVRQSIAAGLGIGALLIVRHIDYHIWQRLSSLALLVSVALLVILLIPGVSSEVYGAKRWLAIGPISFQPSEIMKIALIFYLATLFSRKTRADVRDIYEGLIPFIGIIFGVSFLLVLQPDVGTLGVMVFVAGAIFFVAGARISHLMALAAAGIGALFILIKSAPYRMERFTTFLDPSIDPQGSGYQVIQALIAVGSGSLIGRGFGHSVQKFNYLPEPVGDSIYAVIAEELGFIGAVAVLFAIAAFAYFGYRCAMRAPDMFGRLVATGITTWIVVQAFFNIAAITALMPLTGIPLPFISYGSTALVLTLFSVGVLLNIAQQEKAS